MNYYITIMSCQSDVSESPVEVMQLVKASSKANAREEVIRSASAENKDLMIFHVRVHDTLIGK